MIKPLFTIGYAFIFILFFTRSLQGQADDFAVVGDGDFAATDGIDEDGIEESERISIGGYLKTDFYGVWLDRTKQKKLIPGLILQMRLKSRFNIEKGLFVHTELLYTGLYGDSNYIALLDRLGLLDSNTKASLLGTGVVSSDYRHSLVIDQAYFQADTKHFIFSIGRQVIGWGSAYFVNPTDKINKKDFLNPSDQLSGTTSFVFQFNLFRDTGIRGYISLEDRSHKGLIFAGDVSVSNIPVGLQLRTTLGGFDFSLGFLRDIFYHSYEQRYLKAHHITFDFSGELFIGFYGEIALRLPYDGFVVKTFDDVFEGVFGIDYIFGNGLNIRLEYFRNGTGEVKKEKYNIVNILSGKDLFLAKDYIMLYLSKEWLYTYRLNFLAILNINDKSLVLSPELVFTVFDNLTLSLGSYLSFGVYGSEFYGSFYHINKTINMGSQTFFFKARVNF